MTSTINSQRRTGCFFIKYLQPPKRGVDDGDRMSLPDATNIAADARVWGEGTDKKYSITNDHHREGERLHRSRFEVYLFVAVKGG